MSSSDAQQLSPAYIDKRDAPVRRYLLVELARFGLSGRQWDVLAIIMDGTYGWADPDRVDPKTKKKRRRDRNWFRYEEMAAKLGCSYDCVARAMSELMKANIVKEYIPPTKSAPGTYGVISDPNLWVRKTKNGSAKTANNNPKKPRKWVGKNRDQSGQDCRPIGSNLPNNNAENADNHAGLPTPNEIINEITNETPIVPRGDEPVSSHPSETASDTPDAIPTTAPEALEQLAELYFAETGRDLTRSERKKLARYLQLSPVVETLFKLWRNAIKATMTKRLQDLDNPERADWVGRSPFKHAHSDASDRYVRLKKRKEAMPQPRPPQPSPDPSTRLTTADDPKSTPGAAA